MMKCASGDKQAGGATYRTVRGGEGGIRTHASLRSAVTYRFYKTAETLKSPETPIGGTREVHGGFLHPFF